MLKGSASKMVLRVARAGVGPRGGHWYITARGTKMYGALPKQRDRASKEGREIAHRITNGSAKILADFKSATGHRLEDFVGAFSFAKDGVHAAPREAFVMRSGGVDKANLTGSVTKNGRFVGMFERDIYRKNGELIVHHTAFEIDEAYRNQGIGKKLLAASFARYEKLGVRKVTLLAADDGPVVWPKLGFDFAEKSREPVMRDFGRYLRKRGVPEHVAAAAEKLRHANLVVRFQHDVGGKTVSGEDFLRRQDSTGTTSTAMARSGIHCEIDLRSPDYKICRRKLGLE